MDLKEALERLNHCDAFGIPCGYSDGNAELVKFCREYLSKEPCEDCISREDSEMLFRNARQDLFQYRDKYSPEEFNIRDLMLLNAEQMIHLLPSIRPKKEHWISVMERLPEKSGNYLCTFGGTNFTGCDYYTTESDAKKLFDDPEEYAGWRSQNVVAWMLIPDPYVPQEME